MNTSRPVQTPINWFHLYRTSMPKTALFRTLDSFPKLKRAVFIQGGHIVRLFTLSPNEKGLEEVVTSGSVASPASYRMSATPRSDDAIISLLQEASASMKTANFEAAYKTFQEILDEKDNPNVAKFSASILGMMGECLFSLGRITYVSAQTAEFLIFQTSQTRLNANIWTSNSLPSKASLSRLLSRPSSSLSPITTKKVSSHV
jgi:hypothetical protein